MDTLLTNVGKILDKSIKFTMLCIGVVGRNNRGFSRVYGVIFVQIFTGFYCLFVASLSSKKGIKSVCWRVEKCTKIYEKSPVSRASFGVKIK